MSPNGEWFILFFIWELWPGTGALLSNQRENIYQGQAKCNIKTGLDYLASLLNLVNENNTHRPH